MIIYVPYFEEGWHVETIDTDSKYFRILRHTGGITIQWYFRLYCGDWVFKTLEGAERYIRKDSKCISDRIVL